ncbi:MAG: glycosyltransferase involved in cell wall biosynthesis [Myxococcota bacterium]
MTTASTSSLSVVIPVYRSAESLDALVARLEPALRALGVDFEVILVNDGSPDDSWQKIEVLSTSRPWLTGINLNRNYGQHNALLCGIRAARHPIVVTLDDDLQNPPEEIQKLLAHLEDDLDVVYGTPAKEQHGLFRDLASRITKAVLQSAMGAETASKISAFRAFRTDLRDAFGPNHSPYVNIDVLLTWGSTRFTAIEVKHDPRMAGTSNYTLRMLLVHALNMLTGFSIVPLQIASLTGFAFTVLGILVLVFVLGRYVIEGTSVAGFPFLASVIAIFSGAQLFSLGILGEYLARMHFRTMGRPPYSVRSTTGNSENE